MTTDEPQKLNELEITNQQAEKTKIAAYKYWRRQQEEIAEPIEGMYTLIKKTHIFDGTTDIQVSKDGSFVGLTFNVTTEFADKILVGDKVQVGNDLEVKLS